MRWMKALKIAGWVLTAIAWVLLAVLVARQSPL